MKRFFFLLLSAVLLGSVNVSAQTGKWFSVGPEEVTADNYTTVNNAKQVSEYPSQLEYDPGTRTYIYILVSNDKTVSLIEPTLNAPIDIVEVSGVNIPGYRVIKSAVKIGGMVYIRISDNDNLYWFSYGTTPITADNYTTANNATQVSSYPSTTVYDAPFGKLYILVKSDKIVQLIDPDADADIRIVEDTSVSISGYKVFKSGGKVSGKVCIRISDNDNLYWFSYGPEEVTADNYTTVNNAKQVSSYPSETEWTPDSGRQYLYVLVNSNKNVTVAIPGVPGYVYTSEDTTTINGYKIVKTNGKVGGKVYIRISDGTTEQAVTIIANDQRMTYGDDVPMLTYKTEGADLIGTPSLSTTATKESPVGTYPIKVEKGTVTNEQVTFVDGTLTIEKAPLTVGVQNVTITEGDAIPSFTLTYSGFRNGDTESTAFTTKPKATTSATSSSKPGTYTITVSGGDAKNYALTYAQGTLTIKEKAQEPIADGIYPLTLDMFHEWDGCTANSKIISNEPLGEIHIGETLNAGNLIYGDASVVYTHYADLTAYNTLAIIGTPGMQLRVLLNRLEVGNGGGDANGGALTELNPVIETDGRAIIDLSSYEFVHLNAIKTGWESPDGVIEKLLIVKGNEEIPSSINAIYEKVKDQDFIINLSGQRLTSPQKGINIIGGRKVMVK